MIRENRESWDKSTGPRFLCERWVNAGAWKCGKLPTRREGLEPVLPFSLTLVRYESDHYNIAKILTYSVLGRIRRVGKPRNLGQCFSSAVSTLKASLVCSSGLLLWSAQWRSQTLKERGFKTHALIWPCAKHHGTMRSSETNHSTDDIIAPTQGTPPPQGSSERLGNSFR